jgi:hypothetical protein
MGMRTFLRDYDGQIFLTNNLYVQDVVPSQSYWHWLYACLFLLLYVSLS